MLPLTAAHGETWQAWRAELETDFEDIIAIANTAKDEESMSADTGMNEILVVATKKAQRPRAWSPCRITTVALEHPPLTLEQATPSPGRSPRFPINRCKAASHTATTCAPKRRAPASPGSPSATPAPNSR